jgi:hypothetical protein
VAARHGPARQRAAQVASRPDVLPTDSPDHPGSSTGEPETSRWTEPPVRRKESVARMALGGLGYVITVKINICNYFTPSGLFGHLTYFKHLSNF